jgi:hypothetical protein
MERMPTDPGHGSRAGALAGVSDASPTRGMEESDACREADTHFKQVHEPGFDRACR